MACACCRLLLLLTGLCWARCFVVCGRLVLVWLVFVWAGCYLFELIVGYCLVYHLIVLFWSFILFTLGFGARGVACFDCFMLLWMLV